MDDPAFAAHSEARVASVPRHLVAHSILPQTVARWFIALSFVALFVGFWLPFIDPSRTYRGILSDDLTVNTAATLVVAGIGFTLYRAFTSTRWFYGALALAVTLRLVTFLWLGQLSPKPEGDPWAYAALARSIVETGTPVVTFAGTDIYAVYPPLYSIILAGPLALGISLEPAVLLLNFALAVWGGLTLVQIGQAIQRDHAHRWLLAAYLLLPPTLTGAMVISKEPLAIALVLNVILAFLRCRERVNTTEVIRLGLCAGLLGMAQPAWIVVVPCLGLWFLWGNGLARTSKLAALSLPVFALALIPWTLRNWMMFDAFLPFTAGPGINLLYVVTNSYPASNQALAWGANEVESSKLAWDASVDWIAAHPLEYLRARAGTAAQFYMVRGWHGAMLTSDSPQLWLGALVHRVGALADLGLAAAAALVARRGRIDRTAAQLLLAALGSIFAFNFWFELGERHWMLLTPLVMLILQTSFQKSEPATA